MNPRIVHGYVLIDDISPEHLFCSHDEIMKHFAEREKFQCEECGELFLSEDAAERCCSDDDF